MEREFEMTEEQLTELREACKPVPYMVIGGYAPDSPQEKANRFWMKLGKELGFVWDTARPSESGERFFFAKEKEKVDE